ncbi:YchJ family protein [Aquabacterium sp. OR-4]|uniref:YchJ family protein n=1 Tax=Aquabacterium sp. OR-4 TaxID=2978127 RepID=UPI0021B27E81|nr:YchJ family metal-binding protein [Aquabacterium sp. OR-4]MDT7836253.1 YchJ family metal-binding protein [Aquabacterium sp. OR-4]
MPDHAPPLPATPPRPILAAASACPCGSALPYGRCCGRWHAGALHLQAPDAQALMRSRYSAFVLGLGEYLLATWAEHTRPAHIDFEPGLRWLGLQVRQHRQIDAQHAEVEFVARSKLGGRAHRLHETSRFTRDAAGRWFYVDGALHAG